MEGKIREERWHKYDGHDFLKHHRDILPDFAWTGWEPGQYYRQVRHHGLPSDCVELLLEDLRTPVSELEGAIDLWSGDVVPSPYHGSGARARRRAREDTHAEAIRRSSDALCPEQAALLELLNGQSPRVIGAMVKRNAASAIAACEQIGDEVERLRELMRLRQIQYRPHLYYAPSRRGRTVRVFPVGLTPLGLKKGTRRALYAGCLDCDLTNAQLACAAWAWGVDSVCDHLRQAGSVWPYLLGVVRGSHEIPENEAKGALKEALYATVFGMSPQGIRLTLGRALSFGAASTFLDDPLMAALLSARERELERIDRAGGATDCFGVRYEVWATESAELREHQVRSALAGTMQALELKLLLPVSEDARYENQRDNPLYTLTAWQHDGFSVRPRDKADQVARRLIRLVAARAEAMGIPTTLEVELL